VDYQTLYRRWRPRSFNDFVGQSHVVTTLSNAIETNRVAHAYLLTGPRGTGKTSTAKIFAKALNCQKPNGFEPCDQCSNCIQINEGSFMDVIEIDGASNRGIDEIRELREKVKFAPAEGKFKIYIIDEVHMLTAEAFNALLKTLEEPPKFVVFILATTEVHKIPATILSRCQRFDFKRFTIPEIEGRLEQILNAEKVKAEENALKLIAEHSEGGMRDAISLLEQALAHSGEMLAESDVRAILGLIDTEVIQNIAGTILERDPGKALAILSEVCLDGKDLFQFGRSLIAHFREELLTAVTAGSGKKFGVEGFSTAELIRIIETIATATNEVKRSSQSSLPLELAFIKLTAGLTAPGDPEPRSSLESRVAKLENILQERSSIPPRVRPEANPLPEPAQPVKAATDHLKPKENPAPPLPSPVVAATAGGSETFPQWSAFIEILKKKKRTLAALIQEGKPVSYNGRELVVGLPSNLKFHLENLAMPQNKELMEGILKEVCGQTLILSCVPISDEAVTPAKTQSAPKEPNLVNEAVKLFGGQAKPISKEE
jgi:DNA polymerase-3 subunit gamma/tau